MVEYIKEGTPVDLDSLRIMGNKASERETTITFTYEGNRMMIYTSDDPMLTKLKKLVLRNPKDWKVERVVKNADGTVNGVFVSAPKGLLSLREKGSKREMSDEDKQKAKERFCRNVLGR